MIPPSAPDVRHLHARALQPVGRTQLRGAVVAARPDGSDGAAQGGVISVAAHERPQVMPLGGEQARVELADRG